MPASVSEPFEVKVKRSLLKYYELKDNHLIVKILKNANLSYDYSGHDNWNGGTDLYNLTLRISIELYVELENEFEQIKTEIHSTARQLFFNQDSPEWLNSVLIEMKNDGEITQSPICITTLMATNKLSSEATTQLWNKALDRLKSGDFDGSVTLARTLLESVIKTILNDLTIQYEDKDDLPKLYKLLGDALYLSPSQHTEKIFSQILGGCNSVVIGLGSLRNKASDSHAPKIPTKLAKRHAELAVNLAGSIATFLIETWENYKLKIQKTVSNP